MIVLLYASMLISTLVQRTNPAPGVVIIVLQLYFGCIGGVGAVLTEDFTSLKAKFVFATYIAWHLFTIAVAVLFLRRVPPKFTFDDSSRW